MGDTLLLSCIVVKPCYIPAVIQAVTTASRLNWKGWGVGAMGAIISGLSGVMVTWSAASIAGRSPRTKRRSW